MTSGGLNFFPGASDDIDECAKAKEIRDLRKGYYGWYGLGRAVFQWHPEARIGFAYVPTLMAWYDNHMLKGARLQKVVLDCADALD